MSPIPLMKSIRSILFSNPPTPIVAKMHFWAQLVAILSLASVITASAVPTLHGNGTVDLSERSNLPEGDIGDYPAWECKHKYNPFYSNYMLRGRNWRLVDGLGQKTVKNIVKEGGALSKWRWSEKWEDGQKIFEARVSWLPRRFELRSRGKFGSR